MQILKLICTDSQATLQAVNSSIIPIKLVKECLDRLNHVSRKSRIPIIQVTGLEETDGNETGDSLVRQLLSK